MERMLTYIDGKPYKVLANSANEAIEKARVLAAREAAEQATKEAK